MRISDWSSDVCSSDLFIVTEGLADEAFIHERCDWDEYQDWARFVADERHSPETLEPVTRVPAAELRAAARLYATGGNAAIYYGLGVTEPTERAALGARGCQHG